MRKLLSLLRGLPASGALARATLGAGAAWDDRTELAAAAVDRLSQIGYLLRRAHFKGDADPPPLVPRPGVDPTPDSNGAVDELPATLEEAAAFFRATSRRDG